MLSCLDKMASLEYSSIGPLGESIRQEYLTTKREFEKRNALKKIDAEVSMNVIPFQLIYPKSSVSLFTDDLRAAIGVAQGYVDIMDAAERDKVKVAVDRLALRDAFIAGTGVFLLLKLVITI